MPLMTFIEIASHCIRRAVHRCSVGLLSVFFALYLVSRRPPPGRRYFEEEAVLSYTHYLAEIDEGRSPNVPAPQIAKQYWGLAESATLRAVVLVVRADEAHHRDVNHSFADEIAGLPERSVAPCPPHAELQPNWKKAA